MKLIYGVIGFVVVILLIVVMGWRSPKVTVLGKFEHGGDSYIELLIKNPATTGARWYGLNRKRPFIWYNQSKATDFVASRSGGFRMGAFGKEQVSIVFPKDIDGEPVESAGMLFRSKGIKRLFGGKSGNFVKIRLPELADLETIPVPEYVPYLANLDEEEEGEE